MSRFMRSGWVGFSSSLRETHENNVVKNFVEWFYFVLLESFTESILQRERERVLLNGFTLYFWNLLQRVFFRERERERGAL